MATARDFTQKLGALIKSYTAMATQLEKVRSVLVDDLESCPTLMQHLHSIRSRVKEPSHLREKIKRKRDKYVVRKTGRLTLTAENLPFMVNDLVGVRLIHLHTRQFAHINSALQDCFQDNNYVLREGPIARVWDDEQKAYYESIGVETKNSPKLYSSVHYVVATSEKHKAVTVEIQVRTLSDELWGEVDHLISYPNENKFEICREQIAVLARITSGASRLTDSIFLTDETMRALETES